MAKKRKTAHRRHYRRVGSSGGGTGSLIIGLALGSVGAKVVHNTLGGIPPKISSGIMALGGVMGFNHFKSQILKGACLGIASVGTSELLTEFGIVHGIGGAMYDMLPGNQSQQVIAGYHHHHGADLFSNQNIAGEDFMGAESDGGDMMHHDADMMTENDMLGV